MDFLFSFVDFITNTINSVWSFFTGIVDNTILLLKYIGVASRMAYQLVDTLPAWLKAFGTVTVIVSILYMILGRNTGGE